MSDRPFLLVTNGPTGSGKTGLIHKTLQHYDRLESNYQTFLIDDIIENNTHYKQRIKQIIKRECGSQTLCPALRQKLSNPNAEFYKEFGQAYFETRKGKGYCKKSRKL